MQQQKWLITGVSTGLGRAFAQAALTAGHTVVGTVRSAEDLRAFEGLKPGYAHGRILDVTDDAAVSSVITEVEQSVGPLDVVVANAGYGLEGTFEETPLADVRRQFEVNVFGTVATLRAALPHMRRMPTRTPDGRHLHGRADGRARHVRLLRQQVRPGRHP